MEQIAIITGAGAGVGQALTYSLVDKNFKVFIIGRHADTLEETQKYNTDKIKTIVADVGKQEDREKIVNSIPNAPVKFLVHNAAILGPSGDLSKVSYKDWQNVVKINIEGPLFLTQLLLDKLPQGRVLNISSGFAHMPVKGLACYSISKLALYRIYECLRDELKEKNIAVGSARPGIVDTPMQDQVRSLTKDQFPMVEEFIKYKKNNHLASAQSVANFLTWLLTETSDEEFIEKEWDVRDDWFSKGRT